MPVPNNTASVVENFATTQLCRLVASQEILVPRHDWFGGESHDDEYGRRIENIQKIVKRKFNNNKSHSVYKFDYIFLLGNFEFEHHYNDSSVLVYASVLKVF